MCVLVLSNAHMRRLRGGARHLSIHASIGSWLFDDGEVYAVESEDMVSAFNRFFLLDSWARYFVSSLKFLASVNGGDPNSWVYVDFRAIPMGWPGAVDWTQDMAPRQVCRIARAPSSFPRVCFQRENPSR